MTSLTFHISINARRATKEGWGDTQYMHGLARALRARGHDTRAVYLHETPDLSGADDVVLRIAGPHLEPPVPGAVNLLWMISPPNLAPVAVLRRFDRLFTASQDLAARYAAYGVAAQFMPQATDPHHFAPARADGPPLGAVFIGNRAPRAQRSIITRMIEAGIEINIWGQGWDGVVPARLWQGARLDYDELAAVYARARVVLNSHQSQMANMGMMSNRSYDALASGAQVLSDPVNGFDPDILEGLSMPRPHDAVACLHALLARDDSAEMRAARAAQIAKTHSFDARARVFIDTAKEVIAQRPPATASARPTQNGAALHVVLSDAAATLPPEQIDALIAGPMITTAEQARALSPGPAAVMLADPSLLDALPERAPVEAVLLLTDPERPLAPTLPEGDAGLTWPCRLSAARIACLAALSDRRARLRKLEIVTPASSAPPGFEALQARLHQAPRMPITVLTHDLRRLHQHIAQPDHGPCPDALRAPAQAVLDALSDPEAPLGLGHIALAPRLLEGVLTRCALGLPLYQQSGDGHHRDTLKRHLALWPRAAAATPARPIGVFVHLYYHELAPVFAERLSWIDAPVKIYVSTDRADKAEVIRHALPDAEIRVLPNRGRDIWPKLYGFADRYADHDIVLHLHGKKSLHSDRLDDWLSHILDCLLPDRAQINRILSLFGDIPALGMVAPLTYRPVLGAAHWGTNRSIAQEIAWQAGLPELPDNADLRFPVGSMFWARSQALRPLIDLALPPEAFPPEAGQIDGTPAHAIERLYGVSCAAQGFQLLSVAGADSRLHRGHQIQATRNGDLRRILSEAAP